MNDNSLPSGSQSGNIRGSPRIHLGTPTFICYINDIPKEVNSTVKLYADDILLIEQYTIADHEMLQKDLDIINKWAESWQMTFNLSKCELVQVTNKKHPLEHSYYLQGEQIKSVPHAKYLGIIIDEHLTFNEHIKMITSKANSVKSFLQRNISSCTEMVKEACYKSMIRPILEYSSTVWSPYSYEEKYSYD